MLRDVSCRIGQQDVDIEIRTQFIQRRGTGVSAQPTQELDVDIAPGLRFWAQITMMVSSCKIAVQIAGARSLSLPAKAVQLGV